MLFWRCVFIHVGLYTPLDLSIAPLWLRGMAQLQNPVNTKKPYPSNAVLGGNVDLGASIVLHTICTCKKHFKLDIILVCVLCYSSMVILLLLLNTEFYRGEWICGH